MSWIVQSAVANQLAPLSARPFAVTSALTMLAVLSKTVVEIARGSWSRSPRSVLRRTQEKRALYLQRTCVVMRLLGVLMVASGTATAAGSSVIAVTLAYDLHQRHRHHVQYILYCTIACAVFPSPILLVRGASPEASDLCRWVGLIGALLCCQLYVSGAVRKLQSSQWMNGSRLRIYVDHLAKTQELRPLSALTLALPLSAAMKKSGGRWGALLSIVIAVELALPALLLSPLWPVGVALGIVLHVAFLALDVWGLIAFGIASVAFYPVLIA